MKPRIDWDQYFMIQAALLASRSTCNRLSVGAVLVRDKRIIAGGYNGSVAGDAHCIDEGYAILSLSDPQLVKYISLGWQFINSATFFLDVSIAFLALLPIEYIDDGFPYSTEKYGNISFNTSSFTLVVAALSKYLISIYLYLLS